MAETVLHPRDSYRLDDIEAPALSIAQAAARGRAAPRLAADRPRRRGQGQLRLPGRPLAARRRAGRVLRPLGASPDDKVSHLVASQSHPDLMVLEREEEQEVDPRRRGPPPAGVLLHQPGPVALSRRHRRRRRRPQRQRRQRRAEDPGGAAAAGRAAAGLPTRRDVCCPPSARAAGAWPSSGWDDARLTAFVENRTGLVGDDAARVVHMAKGAPGRALQLAAGDALAVDAAAQRLLASLPHGDEGQLLALADGFRGGEGQPLLPAVRAPRRPGPPGRRRRHLERRAGGGVEAWATAWERLEALPARVEALNLDRADAFYSALADLRTAARASPFPQ